MKDQHKLIKGYRDLTAEEVAAMNKVKELSAAVGDLIEELKNTSGLDQRWISIGTTDLQKGFMAITRSIGQQTTF